MLSSDTRNIMVTSVSTFAFEFEQKVSEIPERPPNHYSSLQVVFFKCGAASKL
uniref:Uncharacterized protein n=1 Tax=Triticum urartu TaxID=4572 RepID=A0A8R7QIL4_TRIUA